MRVLHINSELSWRGGERQVELLAQYSKGQVHSIIGCNPKSELFKRLAGKYDLVNLSIRNGFDLKAALKLNRLAEQIDLIHCHTPKAQSVAVLARLLGSRKPIICTKRTSFPIGENYFSKLKYRKTHQVVCVSQASADALQNQLAALNIEVIHSAIEKSDLTEGIDLATLIPETQGRKVIGYVAAITEEKNPQVFLQTAATVLSQNQDYCFIWIGDGALRPELKAQIDHLNLSEQVFLPGFQTNIHSWIASLDLLFFPSLSEGFPTTILQAMQSSVPIIASDLPGIREVIAHGVNGLLFDSSDFKGFAQAIIEVVSTEEQYHLLTKQALNSLDRFYVEKMAEKYVNLYQEVINSTN